MTEADSRKGFRPLMLAAVVAALFPIVFVGIKSFDRSIQTGKEDRVFVRMQNKTFKYVEVEKTAEGSYRFVRKTDDGEIYYSPDEFAETVYLDGDQSWWERIFNITSTTGMIWVAFGLFGQVLFASRMIIQWLSSEKRRRSHVPVGFWWLSVGGASIMLVYFIWRRDIVGAIGQGTGLLIYSRNLYFIYRGNA